MRFLFLVLILMMSPSRASAEEIIPLKLRLLTTRSSHTEGEAIRLIYSLRNVSSEDVNYFEPAGDRDLISTLYDNQGKPLRNIGLPVGESLPVPGAYVLLPADRSKDYLDMIGTIQFGEIKSPLVVLPDGRTLVETVTYTGYLLQQGDALYPLSDPECRRIILGGQFCSTPPRAHQFSEQDCHELEQIRKKTPGYIPENPQLSLYCKMEDYTRSSSTYVGCLKAKNIRTRIDISPPDDGVVEDYDVEGHVRMRRTYKDGQISGHVEYFYPAYYHPNEVSVARSIRRYRNGILHGKAKDFFADGSLAQSWVYKDGQLHGAYRAKYFSGTLAAKVKFRRGKLDGMLKAYSLDGKEVHRARYVEGTLVSAEE